jgi:DNA-binding transcriptional ArsR family regulator
MSDKLPSREITELEAVRLLAHPLRHRIVQLMRRGPVTSTTLARALGESTGATSYHLREMARYGFIEEIPADQVPTRSHGRERWWRSVRMDLRVPRRSQQSAELRAAVDDLYHVWFAEDLETFARVQGQRDQMGEWEDALPYSRGSIRVTPDELRALFEDYIGLIKRYARRADAVPPGARTVLTRFLAFPAPDVPPHPEDDIRAPEEHTQHPTG